MALQEELYKAKKLARPALDPEAWGRRRLHEVDLEGALGAIDDTCERVAFDEIGGEEFRERFEGEGGGGSRPCIITGLVETWGASGSWGIEQLAERFGDEMFKCGETEEGEEIEVSLRTFAEYMRSQTDDVPLYVFDESWAEEGRETECLLEDYAPPSFFSEDLFQYLGEDKRPPYRWILLGPKRSGSRIHIDPCGTSAWNALISGKKRWVLFPPGTPRSVVKPQEWMDAGLEGEAVDWFMKYFEGMSEQLPAHQQPVVCDMVGGDTIYVPGGWFHTVLNLTDTVAVTQNFVSTSCFREVWQEFQATRAKLSRQWIRSLEKHRPDLVALVNEGTGEAAGVKGQKKGKPESRAKQNKKMRNGIAAVRDKGQELLLQRAVRLWKEYKHQESSASEDEDEQPAPAATPAPSELAAKPSTKKQAPPKPSMFKKKKPPKGEAPPPKKSVTWAQSVQGGEEEVDWESLPEGDVCFEDEILPLGEIV